MPVEEPDRIATLQWLGQHYPLILDQVFPQDVIDSQSLRKDVSWGIAVRILPAFKPEARFGLRVGFDGSISATYAYPNASLRSQIIDLRQKHPQFTWKEIAAEIAINTCSFTSVDLPKLQEIVKRFTKLKLSPVLSGDLYMDPTSYQFHSQGIGRTLTLNLLAPAHEANNEGDALIEWAKESSLFFERNMTKGTCKTQDNSEEQ